jgi:hypothetical protein
VTKVHVCIPTDSSPRPVPIAAPSRCEVHMHAALPLAPSVMPAQGPAYLQSGDLRLLGVLWATPMGLNLTRAAMYPDAVIQTSGWVLLLFCHTCND